MKIKYLISFLVLVLIFGFILGFTKYKPDNLYNDMENNIIKIINNQRMENGLNELEFNNFLTVLAEKRVLYMSQKTFNSHYDFYGFLMSNHANKKFRSVSENLARTKVLNENSIVEAWNNSKTHKENILRLNRDSVGVSIIKVGDYYIISILFGRSR